MTKHLIILICAILLVPRVLRADDAPALTSWWDSWTDDLRATWRSDNFAAIIPLNTYHVRATYDDERVREYNEIPWGFGVERYHMNAKRNRHSFFIMAFADSYSRIEPAAGYAWERSFFDNSGDFRMGAGFNATLTARYKDHYFPIAGATPTLSVNYKSFSVQTAWVPYMRRNYGNIFLTMFKISI
ncbi:MAG: phospholipid:lipid A palmitoyltransferase [Kiritimatiellaeota bacterium]|nr:phospholipid:lipid A palmitoyltransferase [Kiritimatiellota bacterium]